MSVCNGCLKSVAEISELTKELEESARLHGMGASREARLMAQVEELKKEVAVARERLGPAGYQIISEVAKLRCLLEDRKLEFEITHQHLLGAESEIKELTTALRELLRVDDEWHGAVNSEMAGARAQARLLLEGVVTWAGGTRKDENRTD